MSAQGDGPHFLLGLQRAALVCGVVTTLLGDGGLIVWYASDRLPAEAAAERLLMAPVTAVMFIMAGLGLILYIQWPHVPRATLGVKSMAVLVALLGVGSLVDALTGAQIGIHRLFLSEPVSDVMIRASHVSGISGGNFLLIGCAILLLVLEPSAARQGERIAAAFAVAVVLVGCVVVLGYLYRSPLLQVEAVAWWGSRPRSVSWHWVSG